MADQIDSASKRDSWRPGPDMLDSDARARHFCLHRRSDRSANALFVRALH
jgi:hypothetical protein